MQEFQSQGARLAFIDEPPSGEDRHEPILLLHGFASNHAVNWVFPLWVKSLTAGGRRVIALDNRGHGRSQKFYDPAAYHMELMAEDACDLLDHLGIECADVMGYSMGARIAAFLALRHRPRVRTTIFGGMGYHLVDGGGLPSGIAEAMEAPSLAVLDDPTQRLFRSFAEATKSDLAALAACMRGSRQTMSRSDLSQLTCPVLVAVGTKDTIAGNAHELAALLPQAEAVDILDCDHNRAVGDKFYKASVLSFLNKLR
jgi:pimeloyl-ACP methyl ester carboxylesterase